MDRSENELIQQIVEERRNDEVLAQWLKEIDRITDTPTDAA